MSLAFCCRANLPTLGFADFVVDKDRSKNTFRDCGNLCFAIKPGKWTESSTAVGNTILLGVSDRNVLGKEHL